MFNQASFSITSEDRAGEPLEVLFDKNNQAESSQSWDAGDTEGQLSVDVLEANDTVVIVATMAGTRPEDIELHLHNDYLTIRGKRSSPVLNPTECYYQECFWGRFSRTIILPVDVKSEFAEAEYKNGVLTIRLPKARPSNTIPIMVVEE